ncbi:MAG: hypothetical protein WDZ76_07240 [Pseudohongiellaceae bacterium]
MDANPTGKHSATKPPRLAVKALELLLPEEIGHFLIGDLHESYIERIDGGGNAPTANRWFWKQTALALSSWLFGGNFQLLTFAFNTLFYGVLAYSYIEMSGSFHQPVGQGFAWIYLSLLVVIGIVILNNLSVIQDAVIYVSSNRNTLIETRLARIRDLARLLKSYSGVICLVCLAKSGLEFVAMDSAGDEFVFPSSSLGLAWILFLHALAQSAVFSLIEENVQRLLCKPDGQDHFHER